MNNTEHNKWNDYRNNLDIIYNYALDKRKRIFGEIGTDKDTKFSQYVDLIRETRIKYMLEFIRYRSNICLNSLDIADDGNE